MNQHAFSMHVVLMDAYFNSVDVLQHFSDFFLHIPAVIWKFLLTTLVQCILPTDAVYTLKYSISL